MTENTQDRVCYACGFDISTLRVDARFCSNACKMRAYRARRASRKVYDK